MRSTARLQGPDDVRGRGGSQSSTSESEGSERERGHSYGPTPNINSEHRTQCPGSSNYGQGHSPGQSFQVQIRPIEQVNWNFCPPMQPGYSVQQSHTGQSINRAVGFRFDPLRHSRPLGPPPGLTQQCQPLGLGFVHRADMMTQRNNIEEQNSNLNQNPGVLSMDNQFPAAGSQWNRNLNQNQAQSSYSHGYGERTRQRSEPSMFGGSSLPDNVEVYNAFRVPPWITAINDRSESSAPESRGHRTEEHPLIEFAPQSYADTVAGRRRQSGGQRTELTGIPAPPSLIPGQSVQLLSTTDSGALYNTEYDPKQMLGELLYPMVKELYPDFAGKLTGMLLEMDDAEILRVLKDKQLLVSYLQEAYRVLEDALREKNVDVGASPDTLNIGRKP